MKENSQHQHPFKIGNLIKISPETNIGDFERYFSNFKGKEHSIVDAPFLISDSFEGEIQQWLDETIAAGHTGYLCIVHSPKPELNTIDYSTVAWGWNVLTYEYFYAPTYEEIEKKAQGWANTLCDKAREKGQLYNRK
jgi:hypothetical protein